MNPVFEQYGAIGKTRSGSSSWTVPNRLADPLASLLTHRRLAAAVAATVILIGLVVALLFGHAIYVAEATIRVSPTSPAQLARGEDPFGASETYRAFLQQQVYEIGSYGTMSAALDLLGPKRSLWKRPHETDRLAAERLMKKIEITSAPDSYFIRVALAGQNPEGLAEIVNAVVSAYLAREARLEMGGVDQGARLLESRRSQLELLLANERSDLNTLAQSLGVASIDERAVNPYDKMLNDASVSAATAHRNVLLAQARLAALKAHQAQITNLKIAAQQSATDPETSGAKGQLLNQREAATLELQSLGPEHPDRPALEQKIARIEKELSNLETAAVGKLHSSFSRSESAQSEVAVSEAEAALDQAQMAERSIQADLQNLRSNAAAFGLKYNQGSELRDKIEQQRKERQSIDEQLRALHLEGNTSKFVSLDAAALTPDFPQKGRRRIIFGLFVLVALALGVTVPTGLDLIDPRIRTAAELEALLGFPPLGVALMGNERIAREAVRRIALSICRERRASGTRAYVLTPVREGAGTTTLTLALARELCDLGVRAVAIEAHSDPHDSRYMARREDYQRRHSGSAVPNIRTTGGLSRNVALTASLSPAARAVVKTPDSNPESLAIAKSVEGALAFEETRIWVERSLEANEIVLLDAPPLLASADAVLLMQLPAGAILVVRQGRDEVSEIRAAGYELARLQPPVVGAILNSGWL